MKKNVLVVCTGNVCRSPIGEAVLRDSLGDDFSVRSAGTDALVDKPADPMAVKVALDYGYDISTHRSRQLTLDMLRWADLVLCMDASQKSYILSHYPGTETQVARWGTEGGVDVPDPYQRPESAFVMAYRFIDKFAPGWVQKLKG